jgi:hypothetical protein
MRFERWLPAAALSLMAVWAVTFTAAVLGDNRLPGDTAAGAVVAAVLLPVFLAACVLGLLVSPLIAADHNNQSDTSGSLTSER